MELVGRLPILQCYKQLHFYDVWHTCPCTRTHPSAPMRSIYAHGLDAAAQHLLASTGGHPFIPPRAHERLRTAARVTRHTNAAGGFQVQLY